MRPEEALPRAAGAKALAESPHLGRLHRLSLGGNGLRGKVKNLLRERFGDAAQLEST